MFSHILSFVAVAAERSVPASNFLPRKEYLFLARILFRESMRSKLILFLRSFHSLLIFRESTRSLLLLSLLNFHCLLIFFTIVLELRTLAFGSGGKLVYLFLDFLPHIEIPIKLLLAFVVVRRVLTGARNWGIEI